MQTRRSTSWAAAPSCLRGPAVAILLLLTVPWGWELTRAENACCPQRVTTIIPPTGENTLRGYAELLGIGVGATIRRQSLRTDPLYRLTLAREFNLGVEFTFMNHMQPQPGRFDFRGMERSIKFAQENAMKLVGHALIYDRTDAPWLSFDERQCGGLTQGRLDQLMKTHIQTVVTHGGETFYAWDVVNEPLTTDGTLKPSCWYRILGEGYIENAFRYAHEANPRTLLRLNEAFGRTGINRKKAHQYFALIERFKAKSVPIHVAGIQLHLEAHKLRASYTDDFEYFLREAQNVGVQVHITEMDVYQGPPGFFKYPFEKQKEIFKNIMSICLQFSHCTSFTTWGMTDKYTWLKSRLRNRYPEAKPLLFDENYHKKPAYFGVLKAIRENLT